MFFQNATGHIRPFQHYMFMEMGIDLDIEFDLNSQKWQSFDIKGRGGNFRQCIQKQTIAANLNILTCNETNVNDPYIHILKCIISFYNYAIKHQNSLD